MTVCHCGPRSIFTISEIARGRWFPTYPQFVGNGTVTVDLIRRFARARAERARHCWPRWCFEVESSALRRGGSVAAQTATAIDLGRARRSVWTAS